MGSVSVSGSLCKARVVVVHRLGESGRGRGVRLLGRRLVSRDPAEEESRVRWR